MPIYPVILSGGSGTRLWPLSRKHFPKQLLNLVSENSLLQETVLRTSREGFQNPMIICNNEHRFIVAEQLRALGVTPGEIVLEPVGRNTAPAAAVAALVAADKDVDAVILLLPSDHLVTKPDIFHDAVQTACLAVKEDALVTFGITPTGPETGYGYIRSGQELKNIEGCFSVDRFVEKPDLDTANKMLDEGGYAWNSGMFLFRAESYLRELGRLQPEILEHCQAAVRNAKHDMDFLRLDKDSFQGCPGKSIDYAVMEHTDKAVVVPTDMGWNDIGAWSSLWDVTDKDGDGNVVRGDVLTVDSNNNYLHSTGPLVATVGLQDMIVVVTKDAVLVAPKGRAQDVGAIVEQLSERNRSEHLSHIRVHRPWGWYQSLDMADSFQVKRICVNPGARLSLQRHKHRAEHWVVVSGEGFIHRDGEEMTLGPNQSTYIPIGATHRLENRASEPLYLIEVQSGDYLGEDDIERLEDDFARN